MANETGIKHQYVKCPHGCLTTKGVPKQHRGLNNCPRIRQQRIAAMAPSGNTVPLRKLTTGSEQRSESGSTTASNGDASPLIPTTINSTSTLSEGPISKSPSTSSSEQGHLTLPRISSPEIPSHTASEPRQTTQSTISSSKPSLNIPGTPDTITSAHSRRVLGSPVKPMRALTHDWLDPSLRHEISSPKSSIHIESTVESASTVDDNEDALSQTPLEDDDVTKNSKITRPRMNKKTVTYQTNDALRTSFFRTSSQRLKDNLQILGVHTGCIGILYLHR